MHEMCTDSLKTLRRLLCQEVKRSLKLHWEIAVIAFMHSFEFGNGTLILLATQVNDMLFSCQSGRYTEIC